MRPVARPSAAPRARSRARPRADTLAVLCAGVLLAAAPAGAQPIQGPQDQACRAEAQRRVFSEPGGGDLYARGKVYWQQCMARSAGGGKKARRKV